MAFQKKTLQDLINNPHAVRASDLEDESQVAPVEESIEEPAPEEMIEEQPEPEVQASVPGNEEFLSALKKLKAKKLDENEEEISEDLASDQEAPMELRKAAIQKIKQKYLGQ